MAHYFVSLNREKKHTPTAALATTMHFLQKQPFEPPDQRWELCSYWTFETEIWNWKSPLILVCMFKFEGSRSSKTTTKSRVSTKLFVSSTNMVEHASPCKMRCTSLLILWMVWGWIGPHHPSIFHTQKKGWRKLLLIIHSLLKSFCWRVIAVPHFNWFP